MDKSLAAVDWVVVGAYFAIVFGIAWLAARSERGQKSSAGYFLAGRDVGWFVIGASLFASNIGSEHLIGLSGTGAESGLAVGQFEVLASLILLLLGWLFVPFYLRSGVFTMPEFLERRYSPAARWYLAVISIAGYVLTKISVTLYAGGIVFEALLGTGFWEGAVIIVIATGAYTVFGGLRAVLYTDLLQAFVLIGGSLSLLFIGMAELGGFAAMTAELEPSFMSVWRPMSDPSFPWTGILLGAPILGVWYWCTDQFIVQRVLSGRDIHQARRGTIFGGFLKLTPIFLFVVPGMIAHALAARGELALAEPDQAWPVLVQTLLPVGVRGLVVAGLLAALMSSLSSVFNSCSTLITWDIYRKLRPSASERQLVWVGQASTVALVGLGLAWIPMMELISGKLYTYLQSVQAYISPPIAAVFLLGLFWKRLNAAGALLSLAVGFVLGAARLVCELSKDHLGGLLRAYAEVNFLHFALFLFIVCSAVLVLGSFISKAPDESKLSGLTFATTPASTGDPAEADSAARRRDIALSLLLCAAVAVLWLVFSPLIF